HTDYNGGYVFPRAISLGTYCAACKREDNKLRFYSANFKDLGIIETSLDDLKYDKKDNWVNYAKGMIYFLKETGHDVDKGMDIFIEGNIPNGSGLSSSASRSEEHTSELQSRFDLVCRLLLEKKKYRKL